MSGGPMARRVGLIGLGTMGGLIARALVEAGHTVVGHDPVPAARARLGRNGGRALKSNAEVARAAEVLISSLPSAAALHAVVAELQAAGAPPARQLLIETSTLPLADKRAAATALRRQGRAMVDAPISGTATPTPKQVWVMYLSGSVAACREAALLASAFTLSAPRIGPLGDGTKLKLAANHLVAIYNGKRLSDAALKLARRTAADGVG
jgi:3-hydroxyisobutyrate dehydrogenase-like beta-hydroxyacid dehydrogenase